MRQVAVESSERRFDGAFDACYGNIVRCAPPAFLVGSAQNFDGNFSAMSLEADASTDHLEIDRVLPVDLRGGEHHLSPHQRPFVAGLRMRGAGHLASTSERVGASLRSKCRYPFRPARSVR